MNEPQWNAGHDLAIMEARDDLNNQFGLFYIKWTGSPEYVEEYDFVAGFAVSEIAQAEHNGKPAVRFALMDEMGQRKVGRLVVALDSMHEASLEWVRTYDTPEEFTAARDTFLHGGWELVDARLIVTGDIVKTEGRKEPQRGRVTNVEIVPAEMRGGETGLAIDLDTMYQSFLDMDLDEKIWRKRTN